jgi:hypothetical protein
VSTENKMLLIEGRAVYRQDSGSEGDIGNGNRRRPPGNVWICV